MIGKLQFQANRRLLVTVLTISICVPAGCTTNVYRGAYSGNVQAIQAGLDSGENVDSGRDGWTPLIVASYRGNLDAVKLLIQKGANVNARTTDGFSALDYANAYGHPAIAAFLKSKGATDAPIGTISNPLFSAAQRGDLAAVEKWLESSTEVEGVHQGVSSLQVACIQKHEAIAALLIQKGANVNFKDSRGVTPLIIAAQNGLLKTVQLLVEKGAEISATSSGLSAVDVAKGSGNWGVAHYLIGRAWGKDWTGEKTVNTYIPAKQDCEKLGMRLPTQNQLLRAHSAGLGRSVLNGTLWTSEEMGDLVRVVNVTSGVTGQAAKTSVNAYRCIVNNAGNQVETLSNLIPLGSSPNYFMLRFIAGHQQALAGCKAAGARLPTRQDALDIQKKDLWRHLYAISSAGYFFLDEVASDGRVYIANINNTGQLSIDAGNAMLQPLCVR